ncbi:AAA family ATPase [Nocardioides aurantiacus]|uniref:AAA family ATPase n=1 Tax=Nocardioides aurantiacus TaxID=86796 RepID=UPI00403F6FDE
MRLHALEVTAFGPFVETARVDFDALADAGLFLLTGATGAGKTSVLDAVCFGLYGEVPGDRHSARHLRSDQAAPDAEPRVVLRFSIAGRTFRTTRSPAWDRPRRRGEGTRRIQAHVVVEEHHPGGWQALTTRLDEAGHLVTDLLGMTVGQFTQVAMLPQGRFQAFLRAGSAERHAVLQQLFRTRRFEDVERWLVDRRSRLRRESSRGHDAVRDLLGRVQEATEVPVPETWTVDDLEGLATLAEQGVVRTWVEEVRGTLAASVDAQAARLATADDTVRSDRAALDAERSRQALRARAGSARAVLADLDGSRERDGADADALAAHRRAEPLLPLLRRVTTATREAERATVTSDRELAHVEAAPGTTEVTREVLSDRADALREAVAQARAREPQERELAEAEARVAALAGRCEAEHAAHERARALLVAAREEVADRQQRRASLAGAAEPADRDAADLRAAELVLAAATDREQVATEVAETRARLAHATTRAQDLREHYLDLREQRISGMAAELATGLAVGCSCPVCGSADHPSPARAASTVGRADEEAARQTHETADFTRQALAESVATLTARLAGLEAASGGRPVEVCRAERAAARARADASTAAARALRDLDADAEERQDRLDRLASEVAGLAVRVVERDRELEQGRERVARLGADLHDWLERHDAAGADVRTLLTRLETRLRTVLAAAAGCEARERAEAALAAARAEAREAARDAGFGSGAEVGAALLPGGRAEEVADRLHRHDVARAEAERVLADDEVRAADTAPELDVVALAERLEHAERVRDLVVAAHRHAVGRCDRLEELATALDRELRAWEPVRRSHQVTARLASLVEGTSADNRWRMRLSAYVLSERLRQVVAAANERLGAMTDQRFTLEQVDEKGAGERRGGLSLRVRDDWSGTRRDPATLSGGETFVVSLALALGLADTVSHEAGGTSLDTLFIDEGFGSLDAETLDGVMDTLDQLRDGGRVVGLVSHVAELRTRVPSQLEVTKARQGSTLRPVLSVG